MKARGVVIGVIVVLALLAAAAFLYVRSMRATLELGVGYAARVACGCRYLENRPLAQCPSDFEPGMEPIRLSEDARAKAITAYVPLIARRTVRYDPVLGCRPEPYEGAPYSVVH